MQTIRELIIIGLIAVPPLFFIVLFWCCCVLGARADEQSERLFEAYMKERDLKEGVN